MFISIWKYEMETTCEILQLEKDLFIFIITSKALQNVSI